ncbi:4Fe-4S single cluster domain-containing protein [Neobacillus dielmonensis]|uniref:4Fe-4S single cluster domain-containing protein n=1 Tax=Neobacillus dielmonensis TaxID=1347369 RepID=UPI0005AA542A|nr:4Fe-4S single cluster domain-containing protein [Neobacillus dielmonensis]
MKLRIHQFIPFTRVEGPGARVCIQVQGCPIHCPGCAVPFTWSTKGGYEITVSELAERIMAGPKVEGITFLGGEPFEQAAGLAELGGILKEAGLSVMTFSGYLLEDILAANRQDWNELLRVTDLLVDGPFRKDLRDLSRPWVGSSNQRYHFLTERYVDLKDRLGNIPNRLEVTLKPDGRVFTNGMATIEDLEGLLNELIK